MTPNTTSGASDSTLTRTMAQIAVDGYDDVQDIRTASMNRVREIVRRRNEGIPMDTPHPQKDDDAARNTGQYADENLSDLIEEMAADGRMSDREVAYIQTILDAGTAAADAEDHYRDLMEVTEREPIYQQFLTNVYGVSTTLTARLVSELGYCGPVRVEHIEDERVIADEREDGLERATEALDMATAANAETGMHERNTYRVQGFPRATKLWKYCGLAPGQRRRRGERADHSPQAKTMGWLIADCMIRQGDNSRYRREFYDPYKRTQVERMEASMCQFCGETTADHAAGGGDRECDAFPADRLDREINLGDFSIGVDHPPEATPPWSDGHADTRARRYLAKKFLKHYWAIARRLKGLPVPDEYVLVHGTHADEGRTDTFENPFYAKRELARR